MEVWKKIKGYKGYEVSSEGRVKSTRFNKEKILKPSLSGSEGKRRYKMVGLTKNKKAKTTYVHHLVADAFLKTKRDGWKYVVDHIDNNELNNNASNLQIITNRANLSKEQRGASKYTGVNFQYYKWNATIWDNGKRVRIGRFKTEEEAHEKYQEKLKEILSR